MERGNDCSGVPFVVLGEIMTRLAELMPDQYIAPKVARESGAHLVAIASEDIKRLYTLRAMLANEYDKISRHEIKLIHEAAEYARTKDATAIKEESKMPSSRFSKLKAGVERVDRKRRMKRELAGVIDTMFFLEVQSRYPDLQGPVGICLYADRSLCWKEKEGGKEIPHGFIGVVVVSHLADVEEELGRALRRGPLN